MIDWALQAFNVYVDGVGKLGFAEKVMPPKIEKTLETFRSGGSLGEREHATGFKKLEMSFDLNTFDPHTLRQSGLFSRGTFPLSMVAAFDGDLGKKHSVSITTRGQFSSVDPGTWESGKAAKLAVKCTLDSYKLVMDGQTIFDIDVEMNKFVIDGIDEYAWIRAIL